MEKGVLCRWKQTNEQKAGVAVHISDKIDLKTKTEIKDKLGIT